MAQTKLDNDSMALNSLGIGIAAPSQVFDVRGVNGANMTVGRTSNVGAASEPGSYYVTAPNSNGSSRIWASVRTIVNTPTEGAEASAIAFSAQSAGALREAMRIDQNGNVLVGVASGSSNTISNRTLAEGNINLVLNSNATFYICAAGGQSVAGTGMLISRNSTTNRSINAGGTINASGADYAEYMTKAPACGGIDKGQIAGVDAAGLLVDTWSDAVSFLIKSTDPSYVGGDTWANEAVLGAMKPVEPVFTPPVYRGIPHPSERPVDVKDGDDAALAAYEADQLAYREAVDKAQQLFDTTTMPAYRSALADFDTALETARRRVDRMAYCGQVPCNVHGARPGQYVVPVQAADGVGIDARLVDRSDMTLDLYLSAVGIVQNLLPDGRANVRVKPV